MDNNEERLSLENAKRVASLLRPLSSKAKNDLLVAKNAGDYQGFEKIAFENRLNADSIWKGIDDIQQQATLGVDISIDGLSQNAPDSKSRGTGISTIGALAGGALINRREGTYENFQEDTTNYKDQASKTWEEEQKKILKDPNYKPKPGRAISAQEAADRAEREYHEMFARTDQKKAKKWLSEHPDNNSLSLAVNKVEVENKKLTYQQFEEIRKRHVSTATAEWDKKDPAKRSRDRTFTQRQAHEEIYDHLTLNNPEAVKKWAQDYNDPELQAAIERKRQRDEVQAIENQGRVSKMLGRNPAAKFAPVPDTAPPQTTPIRPQLTVLSPTFKVDQNKPTPGHATTENPEDDQDTTSAPKKRGIRSKLNYYSPSQIRARAISRVKNRIINSRLGQKFKKSRIGRLSSKLNRLGGKASRITRRIKNLLNPLSFLLNLIKRSIIGSLISAVTSVITSVVSLAVSITVGIVTTVIGIFSAAVGLIITAVGLPVVIVILIVALLILVFVLTAPCVIFCDQETREFIDSPYPGIAYSIIAPETIQNGEDITYSIFVLFDPVKASEDIKDLTAVTNIPPGTSFVSATGNYSLAEPGKISWKLYPENNNSGNDGKTILNFAFNLIVRPQNDIVAENLLTIEGASGGAPPPATSGKAPNDLYCEDRKYAYVKSNKLLPKNFGDPDCTLDTFQKRNDLYNLLKQKDPQWADFWFDVIIPGESGYRPNAWGCGTWNAAQQECNPPFAPRGAWGLFQMGSSRPPGELTRRGGTRGDVTWKEQVDNAINHNKVIEGLGLRFRYWQVAINYCNDGNMSKPQCRDM